MANDLIIGLHSVACALLNKERTFKKLFATKEGKQKLFENYPSLKSKSLIYEEEILSNHDFHLIVERKFKSCGFDKQSTRPPSQILLEASPLQEMDLGKFLDKNSSNLKLNLIALEHVSDVHNGAAILRTASFLGADAVILEATGSFGITPGMYRQASGAIETLPIIRCNHLIKAIKQMKEKDILCIGLSEKADLPSDVLIDKLKTEEKSRCLFLGEEERGLSHSVVRLQDYLVAYKSSSSITSLNVSVAAAIAMKDFFLKK